MRWSAAMDSGGMPAAVVGDLSGDLGNGERVQRPLSKQIMAHSVFSPLDIQGRGTTPFGLFLDKVITGVQKIIKERPSAKPLNQTLTLFLKKK